MFHLIKRFTLKCNMIHVVKRFSLNGNVFYVIKRSILNHDMIKKYCPKVFFSIRWKVGVVVPFNTHTRACVRSCVCACVRAYVCVNVLNIVWYSRYAEPKVSVLLDIPADLPELDYVYNYSLSFSTYSKCLNFG